jgi:hypothetical protein
MAIGHHITLRLSDDRVIAPSVAARRTLARVVLERGRDFGLVAFRNADNHPHLVVLCGKEAAYELSRRIEISLHYRLSLDVPFERARVRAIQTQGHLNGAFHYTFRQEQHHGICVDPCFEASNLPDLLEMRLLGGYTREVVRERLPRIRRGDLLRHLGVGDLDAAEMHVADLEEAAAAALALPDLRGRGRDIADARAAAACAIGGPIDVATLAEVLGVGDRAARKLRCAKVSPELVRAVELQLRLRSALRAKGE